jgi:hypothetical protein
MQRQKQAARFKSDTRTDLGIQVKGRPRISKHVRVGYGRHTHGSYHDERGLLDGGANMSSGEVPTRLWARFTLKESPI